MIDRLWFIAIANGKMRYLGGAMGLNWWRLAALAALAAGSALASPLMAQPRVEDPAGSLQGDPGVAVAPPDTGLDPQAESTGPDPAPATASPGSPSPEELARRAAEAEAARLEAEAAKERTARELAEARARVRTATQRANLSAQRARELEQDVEAATSAARKAADLVAVATERAEQTQADLEEANKAAQVLDEENQSLFETSWLVAIGGGLLIALGLIGTTFFLLRARKRSDALQDDLARKKAEASRVASAPDWLLVGESSRLKLRGPLLAEQGRGSIVGRGQAEADVIVDDSKERISRRHARFFYRSEALFVEDLGSLNGTYVNGAALKNGEVQRVRVGDELKFADMIFKLEQS